MPGGTLNALKVSTYSTYFIPKTTLTKQIYH